MTHQKDKQTLLAYREMEIAELKAQLNKDYSISQEFPGSPELSDLSKSTDAEDIQANSPKDKAKKDLDSLCTKIGKDFFDKRDSFIYEQQIKTLLAAREGLKDTFNALRFAYEEYLKQGGEENPPDYCNCKLYLAGFAKRLDRIIKEKRRYEAEESGFLPGEEF
jgi:hypothetical protein